MFRNAKVSKVSNLIEVYVMVTVNLESNMSHYEIWSNIFEKKCYQSHEGIMFRKFKKKETGKWIMLFRKKEMKFKEQSDV